MANNSITKVQGIGSVRFRNPDGTTFVLHEVRYMPGIARNLISLVTLERKGCEFKGSDGMLKIVMGCSVIVRGERRRNDTLYILQVRQRTLLRDWLPPSFGTVGLVTWVRKFLRCWQKKDASTKRALLI